MVLRRNYRARGVNLSRWPTNRRRPPFAARITQPNGHRINYDAYKCSLVGYGMHSRDRGAAAAACRSRLVLCHYPATAAFLAWMASCSPAPPNHRSPARSLLVPSESQPDRRLKRPTPFDRRRFPLQFPPPTELSPMQFCLLARQTDRKRSISRRTSVPSCRDDVWPGRCAKPLLQSV